MTVTQRTVLPSSAWNRVWRDDPGSPSPVPAAEPRRRLCVRRLFGRARHRRQRGVAPNPWVHRGLAVDEHGAVAAFLAVDGRAERLAAEHVDDGDGRCCTAGPQSGRLPWPCTLAALAAQGRRLAARDRRGVEG